MDYTYDQMLKWRGINFNAITIEDLDELYRSRGICTEIKDGKIKRMIEETRNALTHSFPATVNA